MIFLSSGSFAQPKQTDDGLQGLAQYSHPHRSTLKPEPGDQVVDEGDAQWQSGYNLPGVNASIRALMTYQGQLIAGGNFTFAGPARASRIARLSSGEWQPIGVGLDGNVYASVWALAEYGGELIAGGNFQSSGSVSLNSVARWDGIEWQPMGQGMNGRVDALIIYEGQLVAGGNFSTADGQPAENLAVWDGTRWMEFAGGVSGGLGIRALAVFNSELIAAGYFTEAGGRSTNYIARWNGVSWNDLDGGLSASVSALAVFAGELVVGGAFQWAGIVPASAIARWNGTSWNDLGSGVASPFPLVLSLAVHRDELFVGGSFTTAGGEAANSIARWTGTNWMPAGEGFYADRSHSAFVNALVVHETEIVAGGTFLKADGKLVYGIARWDGSSWAPLDTGVGILGWVDELTVKDGRLFAGIDTPLNGNLETAVVRFDSGEWRAVGESFRGGHILTLVPHENALVAGGWFTEVGPERVDHIANWDGARWAPMAAGFNSLVEAAISFEGSLYAGGDFTMSGGRFVRHIARWDGSDWQEVGEGTDGPVGRLCAFGSKLVVAGHFETVGATAAHNIAAWDGTTWEPLGEGLDGHVTALVVFDGELVASGAFLSSGAQPLPRVARWDGQSWTAMGSGFSEFAVTLVEYGASLYAGGSFLEAGGGAANHVAKWDGVDWVPLGSGTDEDVATLQVFEGSLMVGGGFSLAGGKRSDGIARWDAGVSPIAVEWLPAVSSELGLTISWRLIDASLLVETRVERSDDPDGPFVTIVTLPFSSATSFTDNGVEGDHIYWYRLVVLTEEDAIVSSPIGARWSAQLGLSVSLARSGNFSIRFSVPHSGRTLLDVFDVRGRSVRTLWQESSPSGVFDVEWDSKDNLGERVARGIYIVRLKANDAMRSRKIVVAYR